jgi:NAD(P)-dependent dehydrogenase (short-subunit alcohol dehydrogenase family)
VDYLGRTAVVTGAGSGIGRALVLELAGRGARVAASDVDEQKVAETVAACASAEVRPYWLDVADRDAMLRHAEEVVRDFGTVHLVVNNAGVAVVATVEQMRWADYDRLMATNLGGVVSGTKAFLPHLIASGDGHLVNVSSAFGLVGMPTVSAYVASKFAVRGFTETLRQEMIMARRPVTVHCVHPGGVRTGIADNARAVGERREEADRFSSIAITPPDRAARTILRGVDRNRPRIIIGPDGYALDVLPRLLGARYEGLIARSARVLAPRFGLDLNH